MRFGIEMKTLLALFVIAFLSTSVTAESVDGKGVLCLDLNKGFFFERDNIVRMFRIYGMEVWDWELDSYDEVGPYRIEWYHNGNLFYLDQQTLKLNGMDEPCEFVNSKMELKKRLSPLPFFEKTDDY